MSGGEVKVLRFSEGVATTAPTTLFAQYYESDAVNWDGATKVHAYDVSGQGITEAYKLNWQLKDAGDDYKDMGGVVSHTSGTNVTLTFETNLPAGTYILVGR